MIELFASNKLKEIYPKVKSFMEEELLAIEKDLLSSPFFELESLLKEKRQKAKKWAFGPLTYLKKKGGKA